MAFAELVLLARVWRAARNLWPALWRLLFILASAYAAHAGGPRWVAGPPYFATSAGQPIAFYTPDVTYFTDPGALSVQVSHTAADAMVAAAAAVWNVPQARLTLAQGGALAEHLSSANTWFDGTRLQLPADAQPSNYLSKPIAVVYDTDGSVIDTLLGSGASDPAGCRQNGVVEDVDDLNADSTIHHALLLINGRCATSTDEALMQLQYQLTRAFGRVLGVGWSQLNDDVFTGVPTPTAAEDDNWPLMHPIDVICGPYTYQCMRDPFRLRDDDVATLVWIYPVTPQNIISGKINTTPLVMHENGRVAFATGEGMQLVNVTVRRGQPYTSATENALLESRVAGGMRQMYHGSPVAPTPDDAAHSEGTTDTSLAGYFNFQYLPIINIYGYDVFYFKTESINPLYTGEYAIAPYIGEAPAMSGSVIAGVEPVAPPGGAGSQTLNAAPDAASVCAPGNDGTETAPVAFAATGFAAGQLCGPGHSSWFSVSAKAGRSFTIEATALDESGAATTHKALPVLGAWQSTDAAHTLPTVAAQQTPFNALANGVTALRVASAAGARALRFTIAEERGMGRPDFTYAARVLYLDTVSPATLPAGGGTITLTGEGFRGGNSVLVNGVAATVVSWTPNTIVASAPSMAGAGLTPAADVADVAVMDNFTGGTTVASAALTYTGGTNIFSIVTQASAKFVAAAAPAAWTFGVSAQQNGAAAAGVAIAWSATGAISLNATNTTTDATGNAAMPVSTAALASGAAASVTACVAASVCATQTIAAVDASQWAVSVASGAGQTVPAAQALQPVSFAVTDGAGHPLQSATVVVHQTATAWQPACPVHGRCPAAAVLASSTGTATADASGTVTFTPLQLPGVAATINMAATTGTAGFTTLTLEVTP